MKDPVTTTLCLAGLLLALAMPSFGQGTPRTALAALQKSEKNRDVRKHFAYAQERKAAGVDPSIVRSLRAWDPKTMNTAKVGKPAPDFTLKTVSGKLIRLSQFRGKQPVVLVFIYGDT